MKTRSKTKTHFVPKVVYRTAFAGVIPICVAGTACGGSGSGGGGGDAAMNYSVACSGFCGVGVQAFADAGESGAVGDGALDASSGDADDGSCFCCTNFCGVGIIAFADAGNDE